MAGCKIFVGSLPSSISDDMLRLEFTKYGQVDEIFVKQGCEPGRQWAMVKFASPDQALAAKENCDRILVFPGSDKPCDVMLAKNQGKGGGFTPGAFQQPTTNGYGSEMDAGGLGVPTATGNLARKIFVGSLPADIVEATLREEFARYGTIEDIYIKEGCDPGRQWAFVTFSHPEQALNAVQSTNGILQFPGSFKPCEVTLARNQGLFGQDPIMGNAPTMEVNYSPDSQAISSSQPRKIFVGSLPDNITDLVLQTEFSKYGDITDVFVKTGCETNRQWAFVTFATSEQAQNAKVSCDRILTFPGSDRPCEVTIARHQGLFGKDSTEASAMLAPAYGSVAPVADTRPRKIFIGSLPDSITDTALRAEFSKYGQIMDLFLKQGQESGRQWAFVTYATADQAHYAKETTDRVLMFPGADRACEVTLARNQGKFGQAPLSSFGGSPGGSSVLPVQIPEGPQPPPPSTPPPPHLTPWRMYRTASGLPYYHNASTGVTQWEVPPDFQVPGQVNPLYAPQPAAAYGQQRYSPY
mmetsp:Transcript_113045/g.314632  ORF Transcript_113045/g.314632 Transcript_113045/m.314632 type:complete len:525 (+) Transcript_113045:147-1721(+)|eukprot:CAMPEP_0179180470 /NCGR_PEP_ID=MMETSP0796-20121207/89345_1 /TAXON_ID=73915 /ORGANISM="Pyrodinium bahamense, Strain pbaha01" /LENGTH=524 /DNA_ID=CAMNT_0020884179 /DNA_START=59 /DNA_END=1633 /DNA_ORIENTATION=+